MQFMLVYNETAEELARRDDPAQSRDYWGAWMAYMDAIREDGHLVHGNGLQPPRTAPTLRIVDGKRPVQAGPYADSKEPLGGYVVMDLPSLDDALEWAARAPCVGAGSVEVRPVLPPRNG